MGLDLVGILPHSSYLTSQHFYIPTVLQETFEGENFRELVKNTILAEKTFADCSLRHTEGRHTPNFRGENFRE